MKYDIIISGTIGAWDCLSTGYVRYLLEQRKDKDIHVAFCSLGGYVKDGLVLNQLFRDHGKVHAHAFGMNASISTIAMLGCADIDIVKGSFFLLHNCSMFIMKNDPQNKEELDDYIRKLTQQRNDLSTFDDVLAQMYADKSGKSKEECAAQMKRGNWLTAQQAVDFGLVDNIREDKSAEDKSNAYTAQFKNAFTTNINMYEEAGIPPLPQPRQHMASVADSEGNPTPTFLQKTLQGIKNLLHKTNVEDTQMTNKTLEALAAALAVDTVPADDKGQVVLTPEQAARLNGMLPSASNKDDESAGHAPGDKEQPKDEAAELRAELEKTKKELSERIEQVENLKSDPSPENTKTKPSTDGQPAFSAVDLAKGLKEI